MSDSNVGLGMVPHKASCTCNECVIDRLRTQLDEAQQEIERLKSQKRGYIGIEARLRNEKEKLQSILDAVMIPVDKWLSGDQLKENPETRSAEAREVALREIERLKGAREHYCRKLDMLCDLIRPVHMAESVKRKFFNIIVNGSPDSETASYDYESRLTTALETLRKAGEVIGKLHNDGCFKCGRCPFCGREPTEAPFAGYDKGAIEHASDCRLAELTREIDVILK